MPTGPHEAVTPERTDAASAADRGRGIRALLLASLVAIAACEREPRTIVAAPADPPRSVREVPAQSADTPPPDPASPAAAPGAPPPAPGGQSPGVPSSAELLAQVEAMKSRLATAPKSLEILLALGNLYFQERRYPDAIGWYDQAVALAEPVWKDYLALPESARRKEAAPAVKQACARTEARGFEPLAEEGRARARKKDPAGAAFCYRAALEPAIGARIQRGNAKLLADDAAGAIADHEAVLARIPDQPDALYFLGLALAETAKGDVGKLERARALWRRVAELQPNGPYSESLPLATAEVERRIAAAQSSRGGG
jgi:tetratricopeptide (TPR) repeat protein